MEEQPKQETKQRPKTDLKQEFLFYSVVNQWEQMSYSKLYVNYWLYLWVLFFSLFIRRGLRQCQLRTGRTVLPLSHCVLQQVNIPSVYFPSFFFFTQNIPFKKKKNNNLEWTLKTPVASPQVIGKKEKLNTLQRQQMSNRMYAHDATLKCRGKHQFIHRSITRDVEIKLN